MATANLRPLPGALIIGSQKSGTTTLFQYLQEHPAISPSLRKEPHFFDFDKHFHRGIRFYRSNFAPAQASRPGAFGVDATPATIWDPLAPVRLQRFLPEAKLIAILREPAARAYSQYRGNLQRQREKLDFREAIALEPERTRMLIRQSEVDGPRLTDARFSYFSRGCYLQQLQRFDSWRKKGKLLLLCHEQFFVNPEAGFRQVCDFLEIDPITPDSVLSNSNFNLGQLPATPLPEISELSKFYAPLNRRLFDEFGLDWPWPC